MTGASDSGGVAIIGIAGRFPGAADHRAFWRNLCQGIEAIAVLQKNTTLLHAAADDVINGIWDKKSGGSGHRNLLV